MVLLFILFGGFAEEIHYGTCLIVIVVKQGLKSPFILELCFENIQFGYETGACVFKRISRSIVFLSLDSEHKVGEKRMLHLVSSEDDSVVLS